MIYPSWVSCIKHVRNVYTVEGICLHIYTSSTWHWLWTDQNSLNIFILAWLTNKYMYLQIMSVLSPLPGTSQYWCDHEESWSWLYVGLEPTSKGLRGRHLNRRPPLPLSGFKSVSDQNTMDIQYTNSRMLRIFYLISEYGNRSGWCFCSRWYRRVPTLHSWREKC